MPTIVWDQPGDRNYESGLDRGVLYLPDESAVAWNGLVSVIEKFDKSTSPVYFDGMKIQDFVVLGDFEADMKAVTYPEEFVEIEGLGFLRRGVFVADQPPQIFGLCYRTMVGDDLTGPSDGYKIHILYNVTAIPNEKTYASVSNEPSLVEFEWTIVATPEEVPGFRPTAHLVIDTRSIDPMLLEDIEEKLYGTSTANAALIPMPDLITFINEWYRVKIVDNGDGTWTATWILPKIFKWLTPDHTQFSLTGVNAIYLDEETYVLSDTLDITDVPEIKITDVGDGSWEASTDQDGLINMIDDTTFEILNATVTFVGSDTYILSDTIAD